MKPPHRDITIKMFELMPIIVNNHKFQNTQQQKQYSCKINTQKKNRLAQNWPKNHCHGIELKLIDFEMCSNTHTYTCMDTACVHVLRNKKKLIDRFKIYTLFIVQNKKKCD